MFHYWITIEIDLDDSLKEELWVYFRGLIAEAQHVLQFLVLLFSSKEAFHGPDLTTLVEDEEPTETSIIMSLLQLLLVCDPFQSPYTKSIYPYLVKEQEQLSLKSKHWLNWFDLAKLKVTRTQKDLTLK